MVKFELSYGGVFIFRGVFVLEFEDCFFLGLVLIRERRIGEDVFFLGKFSLGFFVFLLGVFSNVRREVFFREMLGLFFLSVMRLDMDFYLVGLRFLRVKVWFLFLGCEI